MSMVKVIASNKNNNILIVLPYYSNGANGTWALPRLHVPDSPSAEVDSAYVAALTLKQTVGYEGELKYTGSATFVEQDGKSVHSVAVELQDEVRFRCSLDVADKRYAGMKFPAYVQAQYVTPEKALRMLRKSDTDLFEVCEG